MNKPGPRNARSPSPNRPLARRRFRSHSTPAPASLGNSNKIKRKLPDGVAKFAGQTAYLVTDMSGFTRLTRKLGVIHFSSLIMKMRQLLYGLFHHYKASWIAADADNFEVVFYDLRDALFCALHVYKVINRYNEGVDDPDSRIAIGGVAVGYGSHLYVDKRWQRAYGPHEESTFRLGEDVCEAGEVRVTEEVGRLLRDDPDCRTLTFEEAHDDEEVGVECGTKNHWLVRGDLPVDTYTYPDPRDEAPESNRDNSQDITRLFLRRLMVTHTARAAIDADIVARYQRTLVVCMYGVKFQEVTRKLGPIHVIRMKQIGFAIFQRIVEAYGGFAADERIGVWPDPQAALTAVLELRRVFDKYNETRRTEYHMPYHGFGLHSGACLFIEGSNVHWGDAVNTASKLGEDIAQEGQVYITAAVYDTIRPADFSGHRFNKCEFEASKVKFDAYEVART